MSLRLWLRLWPRPLEAGGGWGHAPGRLIPSLSSLSIGDQSLGSHGVCQGKGGHEMTSCVGCRHLHGFPAPICRCVIWHRPFTVAEASVYSCPYWSAR